MSTVTTKEFTITEDRTASILTLTFTDGLITDFAIVEHGKELSDHELEEAITYGDIPKLFPKTFSRVHTPEESSHYDGKYYYSHIVYLPTNQAFGTHGTYTSYNGTEIEGKFVATVAQKTINYLADTNRI